MKIRKLGNKNGHLLMFNNKENPADNFGLFFPGLDFDQLNALKKAREEFTRVLAETLKEWRVQNHAIGDLREVKYEVQHIDPERIASFALEDFFDGETFSEVRAKAVLSRFSRPEESLLPDLRTGGVASGPDFYDREKEVNYVWEALEKGQDCILRAPRRFGKTSLSLHLSRNPQVNWRVCYVDLEGGQCPEDFVFSILKELSENPECSECLPAELSKEEIWNLPPQEKQERYEKEWKSIQEGWKAYGAKLLNDLEPGKGRLLLILDEFSFLAENILKNDGSGKQGLLDLLSWFEDIRKNRPKGLYFLVSGSEHLPSFLKSRGFENDLSQLVPVHLVPFDEDTAHAFIFLAMAKQNISISPKECRQILELMGKPIPYFLQLFLDTLAEKCRSGKDVTGKQIGSIYQGELLGTEGKRHFESIKRQLDHYGDRNLGFKEAADRVMTLLTHAETVEKKTLEEEWKRIASKPDSFASMFEIMRDDFYLEEQDGQVRFDSKLLKDWWRLHILRPHTV